MRRSAVRSSFRETRMSIRMLVVTAESVALTSLLWVILGAIELSEAASFRMVDRHDHSLLSMHSVTDPIHSIFEQSKEVKNEWKKKHSFASSSSGGDDEDPSVTEEPEKRNESGQSDVAVSKPSENPKSKQDKKKPPKPETKNHFKQSSDNKGKNAETSTLDNSNLETSNPHKSDSETSSENKPKFTILDKRPTESDKSTETPSSKFSEMSSDESSETSSSESPETSSSESTETPSNESPETSSSESPETSSGESTETPSNESPETSSGKSKDIPSSKSTSNVAMSKIERVLVTLNKRVKDFQQDIEKAESMIKS